MGSHLSHPIVFFLEIIYTAFVAVFLGQNVLLSMLQCLPHFYMLNAA